MLESELDQALVFAEALARECGELIRQAFFKDWPFRTAPVGGYHTAYDVKKRTDPVTETDRAVEELCRRRILERYGTGHRVLGEEGFDGRPESLQVKDSDPPTWAIDPIDGTANFVHHIPLCAVSIALITEGQARLGVVYNPIMEEMFVARRSRGAFLNGKPIFCSGVSELPDACIATEYGSDRSASKVAMMLEMVRSILENGTQAVRSTGSAALNMAFVACGRFDVVTEWGPYTWDLAAGQVLVEEAGGVCLLPNGAQFILDGRGILAANRYLAEKLRFQAYAFA
jgi:fructose-1,6-bisphosphatase/inositol monophosphatase family enzyme